MGFEEINRLSYDQRLAAVRSALENVSPTSSATDLGMALVSTADMLQSARETAAPNGMLPPTIVLVSDLQRGSRLNRLEGYQWPQEIRVDVRRVAVKAPTNAHAVVVAQTDAIKTQTDDLRVRVHNAADSTKRQFRLSWVDAQGDSDDGQEYFVDVPPGENRVVRVARPDSPAGRLRLSGDDQAFDNDRYLARQDALEKTVVYLGDDTEDVRTGLLYYLRRATLDTTYQTITVDSRPGDVPLEAITPDVVPLVVVAGPVPDESAAALLQYLGEGGRVLVVLTGDAEQHLAMTNTLQRLTTIDSLTIEEADVDDYAMLSTIDFQHPLFQPFADPRFSDFTKIRFWGHRRLTVSHESPWSVLARFDDQSPALIEREHDAGRLWILTAGWQPTDSQLALSTKFVPLLAGMVDVTGNHMTLQRDYVVGERVSLPQSSTAMQIVGPDNAIVELQSDSERFDADEPGMYALIRGTQEQQFAVNLAAEESRTAPLERDQLERFGIQFGHSDTMEEIQARQRQMRDVELESQQKLWRWMVIAALVVLAAETWLAGRLSRRAPRGDT